MVDKDNNFKNSHSFEKRKYESSKIMEKYSERLPVIVQKKENNSNNIPTIEKTKYLVPRDLSVGQFVYIIRKRIKLDASKALFIFINNSLPATSELLDNLYEKNKDEDGFLYIFYSGENTFG